MTSMVSQSQALCHNIKLCVSSLTAFKHKQNVKALCLELAGARDAAGACIISSNMSQSACIQTKKKGEGLCI